MPRSEHGSTTLFLVVIALALFLVVGLVVDGGGKVRALQRAETIAAQAARTGGQAIQGPRAVRGAGASIDTAAAKAAAREYLTAAGTSGSVRIVDGTRLQVTTTTTYQPVFLDLMGVSTLTTHGQAEVHLVDGVNGGGR